MPLSPNMNLPIPVPSQTGGPQYALDEQSCFQQIDSHNHTPGQGAQIPLNAINVTQNLNMSTLSITNSKSIQLLNQSVSPGSSSLYMKGNDLWWADGTGAFNVQVTSGSAVAVSGAVGFSGLPSGTASAAFLSLTGTFRFQSATNTGASLDIGPLTLRNTTIGSNGITLTPPNPLPANYSLTLPNALPSTDSFIVSDNSGVLSFQSKSFVLPAGVMMMYGGTSAPNGWLFCDGSIVSQATYSALYAVIGPAFNIGGEGAGNFRLPDMSRRVPMGAGGTGSAIIGNAIGNSGGAEGVALAINEMPSHDHGGNTGDSTINWKYYTATPSSNFAPQVSTNTTPGSSLLLQGSSHHHSITAQGGGNAHNNIQPSLVVNYIIKY